MTGAEVAQIITAVSVLLGVAVNSMISLRALRASENGLKMSEENSSKIDEVHKSTNGKMEELIAEVRESSFAKGVKQETDKERKS